MIDSDGETPVDDFNPVMDETKIVVEPKIITEAEIKEEAEEEAKVEKVSVQVVKLEPIVVGNTTIGKTLQNSLDEDALNELTKSSTESIWSNTFQSKGVSPLH